MSNRSRWLLAVLLTVAAAVYQRLTGPTHPVRGETTVAGREVHYRLTRSHGGDGDQLVEVVARDPTVTGEVAWRRYPTAEEWRRIEMRREGAELVAFLPHQPPAGKLEYQVRVRVGQVSAVAPERPAVTRFKGEVPFWLLHPHIALMFAGMLVSNRAGLEALLGGPRLPKLVAWSLGLLVVGGLLFGPAVQEAAFGEWWTGVPFGWDLTDNKTLVAVLAWLWPALAVWRRRPVRVATLAAALVTLVVFAIPHSTWGSELKWDQVPVERSDSTVVPPA